MASFTFVIEDKQDPLGTPRFVFVDLQDSPVDGQTWAIGLQNDWIGTGTGEFREVPGGLELRDGVWDEGIFRMSLRELRYPQDLTHAPGTPLSRGPGDYASDARGLSGASLEWSGRNIAPDF